MKKQEIRAVGMLRVVGVPVGNLGDVSERVRDTLAGATLVACEDTRRCGQLYRLLGLKAPRLVSFHKDNERGRVEEMVAALRGGQDIVLVSDSGMPGISDPGAVLVAAARAAGVPVEVVPGPSAAVMAVSGSGFEGGFVFLGFAERKAAALKAQVAPVAGLGLTLVLYESPQRLAATVAGLLEILGNRRAWVARELTKMHEEWLGPDLAGIAAALVGREVRGECVVVIEGTRNQVLGTRFGAGVDDADIEARLAAGESVKDVAAWVAGVEGGRKRDAYARVLALREVRS